MTRPYTVHLAGNEQLFGRPGYCSFMANDPAGKPGYAANLKSNLAKRVSVLQAHDAAWRPPEVCPDVREYRSAVKEAQERHEDLGDFVTEREAARDATEEAMRSVEHAYARGEATGADFTEAMNDYQSACEAVEAAKDAVARAAADIRRAELKLQWAEAVVGGAARRAKLERQLAAELRGIQLLLGKDLPADHPETHRRTARAAFLAPVIAARRNITRYLPEAERAAWDKETDALES